MTRRGSGMLIGGALLLVLAGCKGGGALGGGAASGWDQADACKTLDKDRAGAAAGLAVKSAELASSHPASEGGAAVSSCTYTFANDAIASLTTRVMPGNEMTDKDIQELATAGGSMPEIVPEPGLGMKAFWSPRAQMIQVFPDRTSWFAVAYRNALTMPGTPEKPGPDPKTAAVAMARKLL